MITIQFILNVIWALLGIAIFIYSFIAIREQRRKTKFESLMLHFRYIEHLTKMRDIFRSYGMNQAADNLDNDIKKLINDLKI